LRQQSSAFSERGCGLIVQSAPTDAFKAFIATNTQFWTNRLQASPPGSNGVVLVDLLHNNGSVLLLNLLLARYVAELTGSDVVAFVAPTFTNHAVPVEQVTELARSFGISTIARIELEDSGPLGGFGLRALVRRLNQSRILSRIRRSLNRLQGGALRQAILNFEIEKLPVGDLIYDSYLDIARKGTIDAYDEVLDRAVVRAGRIFGDFDRLLYRHDVRALIVSHPVYIDYGIPLRLCLKRGIPVYGKVWLDPIGVRLYETLDEAKEFAGMPVEPALNHFRNRLGPKLMARANAYFPPAPKKEMSLDYFRYGYGEDKTEYSRQELIELLGVDPEKKTCLIMAQQFTDAPHVYPGMAFDDYFQWLDETLAFVATRPDVNWLVRQHPYEIMVGETEFFEELSKRHLGKHSHLKLVPNCVTTSSLFSLANAVTTAIGSGGIEFASVGVPCILAGNPFYGDFDFVIRPRTKEAYFAALANVPHLGRLDDRQIMAAKELALVFLSYKRVSSNRVPFISDMAGREITQGDIDGYWLDATQRVYRQKIESDLLYRCVHEMVSQKHKTLLNYFVD
jgi:hypothetical protein